MDWRSRTKRLHSILFLAMASLLLWHGRAADQCVECHQDGSFRVKNKKLYDYFEQWKGSAHDEAGLSCFDCHGGDPEASDKEAAHAGVLMPSNEKSPVFYKNIPNTCGDCHPEVYDRFIQSKHYLALMDQNKGPNCVTCHGSLNSEVYFSSTIAETCADCHNAQTENSPEIVSLAERILHQMNVAAMYRKWATLHYESVGKVDEMIKANKLYDKISRSWHQFDFKETDESADALVLELRALYNAAKREEKEMRSGRKTQAVEDEANP